MSNAKTAIEGCPLFETRLAAITVPENGKQQPSDQPDVPTTKFRTIDDYPGDSFDSLKRPTRENGQESLLDIE